MADVEGPVEVGGLQAMCPVIDIVGIWFSNSIIFRAPPEDMVSVLLLVVALFVGAVGTLEDTSAV